MSMPDWEESVDGSRRESKHYLEAVERHQVKRNGESICLRGKVGGLQNRKRIPTTVLVQCEATSESD